MAPKIHGRAWAAQAHRGHHRAGSDDIVLACRPRQVADRLGEALQKRPDRLRAAQPLRQFVADIAGIEVREDQNTGLAGDRACLLELLGGDLGNQRRVGLELAVDGQQRRALSHEFERLAHLVDARMLRTALGRERQHGDARGFAEQGFSAARRRNGDIGELACSRIGIDRAIGKHEGARAFL
jgi:hypothetical protein